MSGYLVAAFYHFAELDNLPRLQSVLVKCASNNGVMGTILLAREGINGTVAGSPQGVRELLSFIRSLPGLGETEHKESWADENPFYRMKVRLKKEIVTLGVEGINPAREVGEYVEPEDWNALIRDPDVVVIDTRNDYEVSIGSFEGAVNPETSSFREFPDWLDHASGLEKDQKIAMFCTGGIRCEKSTALLKARGFDNVYHLKGGILKYLEEVPAENSLWHGQCFVFDQRVSVGPGLKQGPYDLCHACRHPITEAEKALPSYMPGVSCPRCHDQMSAEQRKRFAERQRQIELAKLRGEKHIAANQPALRERKRQERLAQARRSNPEAANAVENEAGKR